MITEFGHFALTMALMVAMLQATAAFYGTPRSTPSLMAIVPAAALVQFFLVALSFATLMIAFIRSDFSLVVVANNSHSLKPLLYKITGLWGNHEGSMMLWVTILALYGAALTLVSSFLPRKLITYTIGMQGVLGAAFLAFILGTSNPFRRLTPVPLEGNGLNPILQDPGLAFHPPILYLGYVGFSVSFAFAVAGLLTKIDSVWACLVRPWALFAWVFLTLGIAIGSWWAYYNLGWGGWWFWDPVENASLMPWLLGTAFLHSLIVVEKRNALKRWTVLLAIITFSLSLVGTFLVRSGVLTSVHAFTTDPARGFYILLLLIAVIGGSLYLYAIRAKNLEHSNYSSPFSREGSIILNNFFLSIATATVLLGTIYPLILSSFGESLSVGPPYFNMTVLPLMGALAFFMGVGPMLGWKRANFSAVWQQLRWAAFGTGTVVLAILLLPVTNSILILLGIGLTAWLVISTITTFGKQIRIKESGWHLRIYNLPGVVWGMTLGHLGVGILILGITGTLWRSEAVEALVPGDSFKLASYNITLRKVEDITGPNYQAKRATLDIMTENGQLVTVLKPERRYFIAPPMPVSYTSIRTTGWDDLYAALSDQTSDGRFVVRFYHNTGVPLIWLGAIIMALGGAISFGARQRMPVSKPREITCDT